MTEGSVDTKLTRFLFQYRLTPHSTTGQSPAELLLGRQPHSHLDQLAPHLHAQVLHKQLKQKVCHDQNSRPQTFEMGDPVFIHSFTRGPPWLPGTVLKTQGPRTFRIKLTDGRVWRRYRSVDITSPPMSDEFDDCIPVSISQSNTPENSSTSQTNLRRSTSPRLIYHN